MKKDRKKTLIRILAFILCAVIVFGLVVMGVSTVH